MDGLKNILEKYSNKVEQEIKDILISANKSSLADKIKITTTKTDEGYKITNTEPDYAKFVSSGRQAGSKQPPVDALIEWMTEKGIDTKYAFVIGRSIAQKGIQATPFMDKWDNLLTTLKEPITNEIKGEIQSIFDELKTAVK